MSMAAAATADGAAIGGPDRDRAGEAPAGPLPPLRDDLQLLEGPRAGGAPSWTLYDPVRGRFFRIGPEAFALLSRWHLGEAGALCRAAAAETAFAPGRREIEGLLRFLLANNLVRADGPEAAKRLLGQARASRPNRAWWLLRNYLFLRIPLVRPDRALDRLAPLAAPLYGRAAPIAVALAGLLGLFLAARQWQEFVHTFAHFFSWDGLVWFAAALFCVKLVHELGHAVTAKRFGCRVPTMGLALLVLFPVLYTDTSETWRLTSRRQRLAVGAAGMAAELGVAALATLAWGFLPDGPARSAAFFLATTSWTLSLLVNLNPFMRFDGYYLLSDWLGVENLQTRAFALGRWRLRRVLFGLDEPPPERFPPRLAAGLTLYAYATWLYRLALFLAIAALVYALFFKVLGILLFVVEIAWFVLVPIAREVGEWWRRRRLIRPNLNLLAALAVLAGLVWLAATPWNARVALPAVLRDVSHAAVHPVSPGRLVELRAAPGAAVARGEVLAVLQVPELAHRLARERRRVAMLEEALRRHAAQREGARDVAVLEEELAGALSALAGLEDRRAGLTLRAPIAGRVRDMAEGLRPGLWVGVDRPLLSIVDPGAARLVAYAEGGDLARVREGAPARFYPEGPLAPAIAATVTTVETVNAAALDLPYLASVYDGPVAVREDAHGRLVPERAVYRVTLAPAGAVPAPERVRRGTVHVEGEARSLLDRAWRAVAAVLIRESGF
jgi:putative peptide zinc metalloprotease protein